MTIMKKVGAALFLETVMNENLEFYDWLKIGRDKGWCSDIVCDTHEGLPMTDEEMDGWEFGHDDCIPAVRIW